MIANVRLPLYVSYPFVEILRKPFIADVSDPISQISDLPNSLYRTLYRYEWWILQRSDMAMFAETESYEAARSRGIDAVLAKNAVNYEMFSDPSTDVVDFARHELEAAGVELGSPIAIYPGSFSSVYHITETLAAAEIAEDWEFVFIGERAQQDAVEEAAERKSNVYYPGSYAHDRVPGFLQHADVGFCLVNIERPLKILEYGAAGLPVLGMPGDLQKEFSEDQIWFVEPTPKEIAGGLKRIQNNPDKANQRCENLRKTASENSWSAVADMYLEAIRKVVE
ncbi:glycosyltransferase [Halobellus sp. GM3]|uniref:glycosyltransferase n=1 Tax=Halobellus sp. GM3 TaxID=3458410 RepID=UPI00403DC70A